MADQSKKIERACSHCGRLEEEHLLVNFADGPQVGASVLVCPKAAFKPMGKGAA